MESSVPEVRFDDQRAIRIFPRALLKHAVLVPIPRTQDDDEIPTCIRPGWGGLQVFYGDYYAFIKDGKVDYGSAKEQWEAMHVMIAPGYWVKTGIPTAYRATEPCRIVTLIPSNDGGIKEASYVVKAGDLVVRQPGGEVQHIKAEKFEGIYYTEDEVKMLGLNTMTDDEFTAWALDQVRESVPAV